MSDSQQRTPIEAMLRARSVAVVGASPKPHSFGAFVLRQLLDVRYPGSVYPVNPRYEEITALRSFPSLSALPEAVDCAILALGDERLEAALLEAAPAGARSAVIFGAAGGLAADGRTPLGERLASIAHDAGMALCGANGMGFFNFVDRLMVSGFPFHREPVAGRIGFVTHSGSVFSAIAKNKRGLNFNYVISPGQELVTTTADYLSFLIDQPGTVAIGCFLETVRNPAGFLTALESAWDKNIPIVVLRIGRSAKGRTMTIAHSGAIAGEDAAYRAVFERWNVFQVDSLDEMLDTLELLAAGMRPTTSAIALATDSGGERGLLVDVAARLGVEFAGLSSETTSILAGSLDPGLAPINPLELWGSGNEYERVYETCLTALASDPAVGMTVFAVDLTVASRLTPTYAEIAVQVASECNGPFVVLGNVAASMDDEAMSRLRSAGIPVLMGTNEGMVAVAHVIRYEAARKRAASCVEESAVFDDSGLDLWLARLTAIPEPLSEADAKRLLRDLGIDALEPVVCGDIASTTSAAESMGFPVVLKTAEPGVVHKSGRGGVILNLRTPDQVMDAYARLCATFGLSVVVERQVDLTKHTELYLGMTNDLQFGPIVTFGAGGVLVELLDDTVSLLPPISLEAARRAMARLKVFGLLQGASGRPAADMETIAQAISKFGQIALSLKAVVHEIDVNPLLAGPDGVIAVDALVVPKTALSGRGQVDACPAH